MYLQTYTWRVWVAVINGNLILQKQGQNLYFTAGYTLASYPGERKTWHEHEQSNPYREAYRYCTLPKCGPEVAVINRNLILLKQGQNLCLTAGCSWASYPGGWFCTEIGKYTHEFTFIHNWYIKKHEYYT